MEIEKLICKIISDKNDLTKRKLKFCEFNFGEEKDMNNFEILQEYENAGEELPLYSEYQKLKHHEQTLQELNEKNQSLINTLNDANKNAQLWFDQSIKKTRENIKLKKTLKECLDTFEKIHSKNPDDSDFISLYENLKSKIGEEILK